MTALFSLFDTPGSNSMWEDWKVICQVLTLNVKIREANFGYLKTDDVDDLEPVNGKIEKNKSVKTYRRIRVTSLSKSYLLTILSKTNYQRLGKCQYVQPRDTGRCQGPSIAIHFCSQFYQPTY